MFRLAIFFTAALFVGLVGGTVLGRTRSDPVVQPIDFNHKVHAQKMHCRECHFRLEDARDEDGDLDCEDCEEADTPFCEEHAHSADHTLPDIPTAGLCVQCHEEDLVKLKGQPKQKDEPSDRKKRSLLQFVNIDEADTVTVAKEIPWKRVTSITTSKVHFSHRRHAQIAGIACSKCHGDVAELEHPPAKPAVVVNMKWCLDCHEQHVTKNNGKGRETMTQCLSCHR